MAARLEGTRRSTSRFAALLTLSLVLVLLPLSRPAEVPGGDAVAEAAVIHVVRPGESLWLIARRYGVTLQALQAANGTWTSWIVPGQRLTVPTAAGATAGQGRVHLTAGEVDLLARLVRAEAEAESYAGKVAVAAVVLNRIRSPLFPNTLAGVLYQARQFEPVGNGRISMPARPVERQAVNDALSGWDPTGGALYFFNPTKTGNAFLWSRPLLVVIGNHRFTL